MTAKTSKQKAYKPKTLVLFDHDGTLCETNELAYESIKHAFKDAINTTKIDLLCEIDWDKAFSETRGTTEKNLVRYLCYTYGVPYNKADRLEKDFYFFRSKWYENMRKHREYVWDTYYPDAHQLAYDCIQNQSIETWLTTGNPKDVMVERLTNSMKQIFSKKNVVMGTFGDDAYSRSELIKLAIAKAENEVQDFKIVRDNTGTATNIIYIGDSRGDFFSAIEAKVRVIWVPARSLQVMLDTLNQDYVKFIKQTLGDNVLITNDLYTEEVKKFVGLS